MSKKLKHTTLGELLNIRRGMSLSGDNYANSGDYKRLTLANFDYNNHCFKEDKSKDNLYYTGKIRPDCLLKKGAIITPLTEQVSGLLGETARIPEDEIYIQSGDIGLVEPYPDKLEDTFAEYLVSSSVVKKQLDSSAQQTKIRHASPNEIMACEVWIPEDLDVQHKIGKLLSNIDAKIALNNSICSDLEALAKEIYEYWFVQFDFPDENGKPFKSSGGRMVWNEELSREIPEGWDVHSAGEFIRVIRGVSYNPEDISEEAKEGYVPLVKSNNLQNGHVDFCNPIYVPRNIVDETQYLNNNSIFVTMSSGSINHVGKTAIIPFDSGYCYGAFCSKIELNPKYRCLLSMYFTSDFFKRIIHTIVVGTSIKNINNIHLTNNYLALPNNDVLIHDFESRINPILDKLGVIILENKQLTELRDFLLPMLMNGQIKIDP